MFSSVQFGVDLQYTECNIVILKPTQIKMQAFQFCFHINTSVCRSNYKTISVTLIIDRFYCLKMAAI